MGFNMIKYVLLVCLLGQSALHGMQSQDSRIITKLKLVLTAGSCVYKEHQAIHVDALNRTWTILDLFNISEEQAIAQQLDLYCALLEKVQATYAQYCSNPEPLIMNALEESHRSCLVWALAIPSKKISRKSWIEFRQVLRMKQKKAKDHFLEAEKAHEHFALGKDISNALPVEPAVLAWCIELPKP